jgi:hypothetical protein
MYKEKKIFLFHFCSARKSQKRINGHSATFILFCCSKSALKKNISFLKLKRKFLRILKPSHLNPAPLLPRILPFVGFITKLFPSAATQKLATLIRG